MNLYLLIILALGIVLGIWMSLSLRKGRDPGKPREGSDYEQLKGLQGKAKEALAERTEERKEKILEFMKKEAEHLGELQLCGVDTTRKEFDRRDVEKLLDVSDTTALKYLDELEAEGKIVQVGEAGPKVFYELSRLEPARDLKTLCL